MADLAYDVRYPETMPENMNARQQSIAGRVASAARGEQTPTNSFSGRWVGWLLISECSTEGWTACWPEELGREYSYALTLTQAGDRVSGELHFRRRFNVTGTVVGDELTLDPMTLEEPVSSARSLAHLQRWTMRRDAVGQVRGELTYVLETLWAPSLQRPPYVSRYRGRLVYGILEP